MHLKNKQINCIEWSLNDGEIKHKNARRQGMIKTSLLIFDFVRKKNAILIAQRS